MSEDFEEKLDTKTEIEELHEEVKPANKKVIVFNFFLILAIFIGLFIYMVKVDGIDNIINEILKLLPEGPKYYADEE